jgi:hypothetical protein
VKRIACLSLTLVLLLSTLCQAGPLSRLRARLGRRRVVVEQQTPEAARPHVLTTGVQIGMTTVGPYSFQKFFEGTVPGELGFWDACRAWSAVCNIAWAGSTHPNLYIYKANDPKNWSVFYGRTGQGSVEVSVAPSVLAKWPKDGCGYAIGLHEVGAFLGLKDNADSTSVMNVHGSRPNKPGPGDVKAVQRIWGKPGK